MGQTAKIHSKCLQVIFSREDFVNLANQGEATIPVRDLDGNVFGKVSVSVPEITRAAMLEHLDLPYPQWWVDRSLAARGITKGDND